MRHLILLAASLFHHPHQVAKPTLNIALLDRTLAQLTFADQTKLVCVYPLFATK